jgi:hypothetical protein
MSGTITPYPPMPSWHTQGYFTQLLTNVQECRNSTFDSYKATETAEIIFGRKHHWTKLVINQFVIFWQGRINERVLPGSV